MGNQNGSEYGGIMVRTEKLLYFSGETVKGTIYLNLTKPGFQGKVVLFLIKGKEITKWSQQSGNHRKILKSKTILYDRRVVVHSFKEENQLGQFAFPFEVQLPFNLPGSFMYENKVQASITYKFKAKYVSISKNVNDIKHKHEVTIREPVKQELQAQIGQQIGQVYTWCCIDKGICQIWAKTDKNQYSPREFVKFQYDIDNTKCKQDIDMIQINFINRLELRHKGNTRKIIFALKNTMTHQGVKAFSRIETNEQRTGEIQLVDINDKGKILYPTINGFLVKSNYYIQIKPVFSGCICCSANQASIVYIPITLLEIHQQIFADPITQPMNWQPQQFGIYQINDSNYQVAQQENQNFNQMASPMMIGQ